MGATANTVELESLLVKLVGDGSHYIKTLQEAEAASKEHAKKLAEEAEKGKEHLRMLGEGVEGVTSKWNALKAAVAGFIGFEVIKTGFEWIKGGIEDVANLAKQAQRFNVSTEKLAAIQYAAGKEAGTWESALRHLNMQLGAVAIAGDKTTDIFGKMGLSGSALAAMGNDAALDVLATKFKEMGSSAESSSIAQRLFGREAAMLLPILRKGAEGFKEADEAAKKMGYSISSVDASKALAAEEALDHLGKALQGLKRTAAAAFAPMISDFADQLTALISKAGGGKKLFHDLADSAKNFVDSLLDGIEKVVVKSVSAIQRIAEQVKSIVDRIPGLPKAVQDKSWTDHVVDFGWQMSPLGQVDQQMNFWGGKKKESEDWGKMVEKGFEEARKVAKEKGNEFTEELDKIMEKVGKAAPPPDKQEALTRTADELISKLEDEAKAIEEGIKGTQRMKLAKQGLNEVKLQEIDIAQQYLDVMKEHDASLKKDEDAIKKITDEAQGPLVKLKDQIEDLKRYLKEGKISPGQYAAALAEDFKKLDKEKEVKHPEAAQAGSKQAYDAIMRAEDNSRKDVQSQIRDKIDMLVKQGQEKARIDAQVADALTHLVGVN